MIVSWRAHEFLAGDAGSVRQPAGALVRSWQLVSVVVYEGFERCPGAPDGRNRHPANRAGSWRGFSGHRLLPNVAPARAGRQESLQAAPWSRPAGKAPQFVSQFALRDPGKRGQSVQIRGRAAIGMRLVRNRSKDAKLQR